MDHQTPQLPPSELYDKRRSKDASRLRAYNKILEQIYNRIRSLSKLPNSQCNLLYTVPPFILGLPKIDLEDLVSIGTVGLIKAINTYKMDKNINSLKPFFIIFTNLAISFPTTFVDPSKGAFIFGTPPPSA